jgi:hypothetical protein
LTIRGAQLYGYLDGTIKEPPSTIVISKDDKMKQVENPTQWFKINKSWGS